MYTFSLVGTSQSDPFPFIFQEVQCLAASPASSQFPATPSSSVLPQLPSNESGSVPVNFSLVLESPSLEASV